MSPRITLSLLCLLPLAALAAPPPPAAPAGPEPSFNVINKSGKPLTELYATPAGRDNWGRSRLEGRPVAPGATFAVKLPRDGNCVYDIRLVYADGSKEDRRAVDTCKLADVILSPAAAAAPAFKLVNKGAAPIAEVFAVPVGTSGWGTNLLGDAPLAPGADRAFTLPATGGCSYNLRVVFADRKAREKKGTDLCRRPELPVN